MKLFYSTEGEESQPGRPREQAAKPPLNHTAKQRAEEREHKDGQTQQNNCNQVKMRQTVEKSKKRPIEVEEQKKENQNPEPKDRHPIWYDRVLISFFFF